MSSPPKTIRIFISSPGDVQEERNRAKAVVEQLRRSFAGKLMLEAVLWEELPLQVDMSFQEGIDLVLSDRGIDIAVFILWSRLGSPTGPLMVGDDKRSFRSGTEREWQLMLQSRDQCILNGLSPRPAIIAYTRRDDESFVERLRGKSDEERANELEQKKAVTGFIKEEFKDSETGANIRAYHSFDQPTTFAKQLRTHLSALLETMCSDSIGKPFWDPANNGPPFRGLDVFEFEHSPIFFGREDEIVAIRSQLREQACRGCAFILISGPSGSGKSSLARAGVLPDICAHELDSDVRHWRWLAIRPSELGDDLLAGLLHKLSADRCLSELQQWSDDIEIPKDRSDLRDWIQRLGLRVKDALRSVKQEGTRLVLLVDQLEELFSQGDDRSSEVQGFFEALEALARSRMVWVIATVRSDFYQQCQAVPSLVRMKEGLGNFDLTPPGPNDLLRVITGPATLAGLRFEKTGERNLGELILREAANQSEMLPLIEHLLLDLFEHRTKDGMLTMERYQGLDGLHGALRQHCEQTFAKLTTTVQANLDRVLSQLVNLSGDNLDSAVRRTVPLSSFDTSPESKQLVSKLIDARLLTTSADPQGAPLVSVAHEAILRSWPRVTDWIDRNRDNLRVRSRVEHSESRWREQQDSSLLLQRGLPLKEGRQLLESAPELLSPDTTQYVKYSIDFDHRNSVRKNRNWAIALGTLACAIVFSVWFTQKSLRLSRVEGLIANLIESDPERLVENIQKLEGHYDLAKPMLLKMAKMNASTNDERRTQVHAQLALVSKDPSWIDEVENFYLSGAVNYLLPVREILREQEPSVVLSHMQGILSNSNQESEKRFRAAIAIAAFDNVTAMEPWDEATVEFVVSKFVSANPEFQPIYRRGLRSVKEQLLDPLSKVFSDTWLRETVGLAAATAIADFAPEDTQRLCKHICEATPEQHAILFPLVERLPRNQVIENLSKTAETLPPENLGSVPRIAFGKRRANAAVALLGLGEKEKATSVFNWTDDPEALTQFMFRCKPRGIPVGTLLDLLEIVSAAPSQYPKDTRYALLLSIGEYGRTEIPADRIQKLIDRVSQWYANDPSSGVHGAAGWLLRNLGREQIAKVIDELMVPYTPGCEWFTMAVTVQPNSLPSPDKKTFYYTFVMFPKGEYTVGSPEDEAERDKDELIHTVILTRSFAILDREITSEEMIAYAPENYSRFMREFNGKPAHAAYGPDWYDAVAFSRWMSTQMGMSESEQCYPNPDGLDESDYPRDPGVKWAPKNWPLDLGKRGFRLPTEAEWEIAARSGSKTAYGFGSEVELLNRFGWFAGNSGKKMHTAKELMPNSRGLFDMHGNASEWAHDWYGALGAQPITDPLGSNEGSLRLNRGGGWRYVAAYCRSADRIRFTPDYRGDNYSFRVALTSPTGFPQSPEADK